MTRAMARRTCVLARRNNSQSSAGMACASAPNLALPIRGGDGNVCMKFLDAPDPGLRIIVGVLRGCARKSNAYWLRGVGPRPISVAGVPQVRLPNRSRQLNPAPLCSNCCIKNQLLDSTRAHAPRPPLLLPDNFRRALAWIGERFGDQLDEAENVFFCSSASCPCTRRP